VNAERSSGTLKMPTLSTFRGLPNLSTPKNPVG